MRTLVFTDLDGTLLDHRTYALELAAAALRALRDREIPVIFCTSKTRAEVEAIRAGADNTEPFIVENGGAVFLPADYFGKPPDGGSRVGPYDRILLGASYGTLVTALRRVRAESGIRIRSFADLSAFEIAEATGLSPSQAELARQREFDEPFLIEGDDGAASRRVAEAIAAQGLRCTRGGRFFHITGDNDKGRAVRILINLYRRHWGPVHTIALGDSPNDLPMLEAADAAVLIAKPDGTHDAGILKALPRIRQAGMGPAGWAAAVTGLLLKEEQI